LGLSATGFAWQPVHAKSGGRNFILIGIVPAAQRARLFCKKRSAAQARPVLHRLP
jgi:hypothetical protein